MLEGCTILDILVPAPPENALRAGPTCNNHFVVLPSGISQVFTPETFHSNEDDDLVKEFSIYSR